MSITLMSAAVQNAQKEEFMRVVQEFISDSIQTMTVYIVDVSTVDTEDGYHKAPNTSHEPSEQMRIKSFLQQRSSTVGALQKEATPSLPHLLDLPKHLAVVSSLVARYSRSHADQFAPLDSSASPTKQDLLREFCSRCIDVEDQALFRVSRLAVKTKQHSVSQKRSMDAATATSSKHASPVFSLGESKASAARKAPREKRSSRPSTAPSPSTPSKRSINDASVPPSPISRRQLSGLVRSVVSTSTAPPQVEARSRDGETAIKRTPPSAYRPRSNSTNSTLQANVTESPLQVADSSASDNLDDQGRRKKGLLRGIWNRK